MKAKIRRDNVGEFFYSGHEGSTLYITPNECLRMNMIFFCSPTRE